MTSPLILDGHKLGWHLDRVRALINGELVAPITIDMALSRKCNFKCIYCYGQLQSNHEEILSRDILFNFLDDAAEIGVKAVSLVSDGESTMSPHLYDVVERGRANGLDMALGSNGYLLTPGANLERLLENLTYLRFNISAADPERFAAIHGVSPKVFEQVRRNIEAAVRIKRAKNLPVTIGMQMVLMPDMSDQIIPLSRLALELEVDYLVIKHCSDDEMGSLGVDYSGYEALRQLLVQAESMSAGQTAISVKWSKIMSGGQRGYSRCYGPPLMLQISGSGLLAPCGMLFNSRYAKYHIGNIAVTRLKELWKSDRYWQVMNLLAAECFDAQTMCGSLCLQHKINEFLWALKQGMPMPDSSPGDKPQHINFI